MTGSDHHIAVVGVACRFPGSDGPDDLWRHLCAGTDLIRTFSRAELAAAGIPAEALDHPQFVGASGAIDGVELFDRRFFGLTQREAELLDPQHRILLECCWEAFEDAGQAPGASGAVGVYVGAGMSLYAGPHMNSYYSLGLARRPDLLADLDGPQVIIANARDYVATQVSYRLGLRGPSIDVQTACSTSLVAIHVACQALRAGDCDAALAGGAAIHFPVVSGYLHREGGIFSPDGRCRAFDERAAGLVGGSGAGIVLLKRLESAEADGNRIYAVIRSSAINNDGNRKVGYMAPSPDGQTEVIRAALAAAGVSARSIGYVEAHGTATALGDAIEVAALTAAFREHSMEETYCGLGSIKTNIGHLDSAAGIAGFIKATLAVYHGELPPSLHFTRANPALALETSPFFVVDRRMSWPGERPRRAGVSSFGAGGTNAHAVIEEPPPEPPGDVEPGPWLLTVSAKSEVALRELIRRHDALLDARPDICLADAAYTTHVGRPHFQHRLAVTVQDVTSARASLAARLARPLAPPVVSAPAVAFLFTGQGAQLPGMARGLYEADPRFRAALDRCDAILGGELPRRLLDVIFDCDPGGELHQTRFAQPALFAVEYALFELWRSWGVEPAFVFGHSVGELVAACVSGVMSVDDALSLVAERGRLMQSLPGGGAMAAVFAPIDVVQPLLPGDGAVSLAAVNGPATTVVSGGRDAVEAFRDRLRAAGVESRPLQVSHAFHSQLMDPVLEPLRAAAARVRLSAPTGRIVSGLTGCLAGPEIETPDYWALQARQPVLFADGIRTLWARGCRLFLEVGPQPTLARLGRACVDEGAGTWLHSLRSGGDDWEALLSTLGTLYERGVPVDWEAFHLGRRRRRVRLPGHPLQKERCWIDPPSRAGTEMRAPCRTYHVEWGPPPLGAADVVPPGGRWLLITEAARAGSLRAALAHHRAKWEMLAPGWSSAELVRVLAAIEGVVFDCQHHHATLDAPIEPVLEACDELRRLAHTLIDEGLPLPRGLWIVTRGAQATADEEPDLAQAALWGMARSLRLEHPELGVRCRDLDPAPGDADPTHLARLFAAGQSEPFLALRRGELLAPWIAPAESRVPSEGAQRGAGGTCLIAGGLGEIGTAVAERLAAEGRYRAIVVVGRRDPTPASEAALVRSRSLGVDVAVWRADVTDAAAMARLVERISEELPPLRAVIHVAGVIDDAPLHALTRERCDRVLLPKVAGAWNIHVATLHLPIEAFVLFSSAASLVGSPGQTSYAAANAYLDALALYRSRLGLPAIAFAWGPWSSLGMAERQGAGGAWPARIEPSAGTSILLSLMRSACPQVAVLPIDVPRSTVAALAERIWPRHSGAASRVVNLRMVAEPDRGRRLAELCRDALSRVLGVAPEELRDTHTAFAELGLDSLVALQLRNLLGRTLGLRLPSTIAFSHPNLEALQGYLAEQLWGAATPDPNIALDQLSERELAELLRQELER